MLGTVLGKSVRRKNAVTLKPS